MLESLVERAWSNVGADQVRHVHERCHGCMQAELGWRDALRACLYQSLIAGVVETALAICLVYWWQRWRHEHR
jgi:uncharacterized protein (DUF2062 family)